MTERKKRHAWNDDAPPRNVDTKHFLAGKSPVRGHVVKYADVCVDVSRPTPRLLGRSDGHETPTGPLRVQSRPAAVSAQASRPRGSPESSF